MTEPLRRVGKDLDEPQEDQEPISSSRVLIRNVVDPVGGVPPAKPVVGRLGALSCVGAKGNGDEISSLDAINAHIPESSRAQSRPLPPDHYLGAADAHPRDQGALAPPEVDISQPTREYTSLPFRDMLCHQHWKIPGQLEWPE